ncbi:hypothetical protein HMPREF1982_02775 [Clostridiales bacterium oral taxon 876 str. F0540]|nr:hypothetical protein HMPREF1982_02775 [Clostridiales bacterium oral taxon 876 str. F0540]
MNAMVEFREGYIGFTITKCLQADCGFMTIFLLNYNTQIVNDGYPKCYLEIND